MSSESIKKSAKSKRGYMYIGHLPHGFYEKQIKAYFGQFGKVKRIRLSRSKKTGNYRGYGFIEFESESVAKIAAETMNNYLMFNRILKCQQIEKEKLHPNAFKNSMKLFVKPVKSWFRRTYNRKKSQKEIQESKKKASKKLNDKQKKLAKLGIDIDVKSLVQVSGGEEAKADTNNNKKRKAVAPVVKEEEKTVGAKKQKKTPEKVVSIVAAVKPVKTVKNKREKTVEVPIKKQLEKPKVDAKKAKTKKNKKNSL